MRVSEEHGARLFSGHHGRPRTLTAMRKRAAATLFAAAMLYGLAGLAPQQLLPSAAEAQAVTIALDLLILAGLLGAVRHEGLWGFCGLAWSRDAVRRLGRLSLPFAPILIIPLLNIAIAWGTPPLSVATLALLLCGAVVEELLLRGLTLPLLVSYAPRHTGAAVLATAGLFAALHLPNLLSVPTSYVLAQVIVAFFLGLALGYMRVCTASVYPGIVAHILVNVTATGPILCEGQQFWLLCVAAAAVGAWSYLWWKKLRPQA